MKVFVPGLNKEGMGGGNTFLNNFKKQTTLTLQDSSNDADVMFVPNPMWAERIDFEAMKGKKVILRCDNIPEDWNNRGTAISKLKDFITMSDVMIYQSKWAAEKYREFITANGIKRPDLFYIIHNGVDTDLFTPDGDNIVHKEHPVILFVKSSRNENKRYPEVMEVFRRYYYHNPKSKLLLVGQFADDLHKYNFGFYNGENVQYLGMPPHEQMPMIYRSADVLFFPAFADAAPNVVLEAMSCGVVPIIHSYGGGDEFISFPRGHNCVINSTPYDPVAMIQNALTVDRETIRDSVVKNFNIQDCVKKYEEVLNGS